MTSSPPPDLRERRRREMTRVIANAAVDLFERQGVSATTVDDIAAAAGISRTTFFRHCAGKEAAVLVDDGGFQAELVDVATRATAASARRDLDDAWRRLTRQFDADAEGYDRFLRVRRLMMSNPALLAAGLQRNAELAESIAGALHAPARLGALDARAVAESFTLSVQLTLDEWVRRVDDDVPTISLGDIHAEVLVALDRASSR